LFGQSGEDRVSTLWLAALLILTESVYLPWSVLRGRETLYGWDYFLLHARRLAFARDALFSGLHLVPGWYPREMLGTPFNANLQNFPWIPSHLVLLFLDPALAYSAGVAIAAAFSALFTYLFCRRAGLSQIAAVAAGWTFACSGFFAARVMVGHLLTLEAYPSLPLLLWLADRATDPQRRRLHRGDILALAVATGCVVVAGHPQLPAYSVAATLLYVAWRSQGVLRARLLGAVALGAAATMVVWWPMLLLIQRSTRVLHLTPASNDIVMPYRRLLALAIPGIDGWANGAQVPPGHPFTGYSHPGYFWDTFAYSGALPLLAVGVLVILCAVRRRWPAPRWAFLAVIGIVALLGALPLLDPLRRAIPVTILRSPSRLLYLYTFSVSIALGVGVDAFLRWNPFKNPILARVVVFICLALHGWDLGGVARLFILPTRWRPLEVPAIDQILAREPGDSRVAVNRILSLRLAEKYDDPGGFDSIFLADTYRTLASLTNAPAGWNEEVIDASTWPAPALKATGAKYAITWQPRKDLDLITTASGLWMYRIDDPAPRATGPPRDKITYLRPSSDEIVIRSEGSQAGPVSVLEASDSGWSAKVDGAAAHISDANGLGMSVPVAAGSHEIRLRYRTPGRTAGLLLSLLSVSALAALIRPAR
jgi:hypothetical protein